MDDKTMDALMFILVVLIFAMVIGVSVALLVCIFDFITGGVL